MHTRLEALVQNMTLSGHIAHDVPAFLTHHGQPKTAKHSCDVAQKAHELALQFGIDAKQAEIAGWLHDISAVFPSSERATIARDLGLAVLPEEAIFPMIIHQKLSAVIAREIFHVDDEAVLSAIACHTTLKADATLLDTVVFVADKIAWDQFGNPPYLDELLLALDKSIYHAAFVYLDYLWQMRDQLKVLHPWTAEAYTKLQTIAK